MKKVFALVLAVAMVMSLTAVSFAATKNEVHQGVVAVDGTAYKYGADSNNMTATVIQYGKAAYYPLFAAMENLYAEDGKDPGDGIGENLYLISDSEMVDGLKVKVDYEMGKDLVAQNGVSIVKKRVDSVSNPSDEMLVAWTNTALMAGCDEDDNGKLDKDELKSFDGGYFYFIEIKTNSKETTSDADIIATLTLNKSKKGDNTYTLVKGTGASQTKEKKNYNYKVKDLEVDISTNVGYEKSYLDSANGDYRELKVDSDTVGDGIKGGLQPEEYYLLKYDYDEETEFTFGSKDGQNEGVFTVDVSGQGKNLLYYDTKLDDGIAAANPDARIFALNFNNFKFNRTGVFTYEAEDMEYAYEVMEDGSLKLLGEFDGEEVSFKTRVLGKYLFSDIELVAAAKEETVVTPSEVPTVEVTNPTTGAIA